jgi:hypothetical protein
MSADRQFEQDDMRRTTDPNFQQPHFAEYLGATDNLHLVHLQRERAEGGVNLPSYHAVNNSDLGDDLTAFFKSGEDV